MGRLVEARDFPAVELTARSRSKAGDYAERVAKYIPSEIVAAYISLNGIVKSVDPNDSLRLPASWAIFGMCLILTPIYLRMFASSGPLARTHLLISTAAFLIWGYALGGPFEIAGLYKAWLGSVLLGSFTLLAGVVVPRK